MASESPDDSLGLGLDEPPQPAKAQPYRVLARKYRPQSFGALVGQDAMVRTLGNAIKRDRLAHAFLLTDVREIMEGVRYAAVSAPYKVYIIEEAYMLPKNVFKAL